jgi:hypothetical protein
MSEEIPRSNPPLTAEERAAAEKLTDTDLQIIDAAILANCAKTWLKVARAVWDTEKILTSRYPGLSYIFYTDRLGWLVEEGRLESRGDLAYMRFSEVRIPNGNDV